MNEMIYNYLKDLGHMKEEDGNIAYNAIELQNGKSVVLKGNKLGLIFLADYLLNIALSEEESCHVHLDEINFFDDANVELVILKK